MRGTGIDLDVEIYATKQSNEYKYMELKNIHTYIFQILCTELHIACIQTKCYQSYNKKKVGQDCYKTMFLYIIYYPSYAPPTWTPQSKKNKKIIKIVFSGSFSKHQLKFYFYFAVYAYSAHISDTQINLEVLKFCL
jgi:hypothetical protein